MSYSLVPDAAVRRSRSTSSVSASATTYHSLHDTELYDPALTSEGDGQAEPPKWKEDIFKPAPMKRHDSGYASIPLDPSSADSYSSGGRRPSTTSSGSSSHHARLRTRHSIHRTTMPSSSHRNSVASTRSLKRPWSQQQPTTYYHVLTNQEVPTSTADDPGHEVGTVYPPPPQTTHYWTSDHTRRLEYAAIDAASQGLRGWILKHVVPDCFVPKQSRRLGFDDDTGSVRRYRLDLECDDDVEKPSTRSKKMGWLMGKP
jgi:hypothetical protein